MTGQTVPMSRLRKVLPGELDEAQRRLYESFATGPRANWPTLFRIHDAEGGLEGPFNAMLLAPAIGDALQALGQALKGPGSKLTARQREIVILTGATVWRSAFERYAHEAVGRSIGLLDDELEGLRRGEYSAFVDPAEQLVGLTAVALAERQDLDDDEYAAAVDGLGEAVVYEISTLVGYYAVIALHLRLFRVPLPE